MLPTRRQTPLTNAAVTAQAEQKDAAFHGQAPAEQTAPSELSPSLELLASSLTEADPVLEVARLYQRAVLAFARVTSSELQVWP